MYLIIIGLFAFFYFKFASDKNNDSNLVENNNSFYKSFFVPLFKFIIYGILTLLLCGGLLCFIIFIICTL